MTAAAVHHRLYCFHVKNSTKLKKQTKKNAVGNFLVGQNKFGHIYAIIKATHFNRPSIHKDLIDIKTKLFDSSRGQA